MHLPPFFLHFFDWNVAMRRARRRRHGLRVNGNERLIYVRIAESMSDG